MLATPRVGDGERFEVTREREEAVEGGVSAREEGRPKFQGERREMEEEREEK